MTRCDTQALSLFLDAELPLRQRGSVLEHLHSCVACREELARLRGVDQVIVKWSAHRDPIPASTEARVHRSVAKRKRLGPIIALGRMMPAAVGTSVAALLVLVTVNLTPLYRTSAPPTPSAVHPVAAASLKQQSLPLRFQRAKSAVSGNHAAPQPVYVDRHPELDIY